MSKCPADKQMSAPADGRKRPLWVTVLPSLLVLYAATGIYTVKPDERAVVRRCGKALKISQPPGLHLGLPWGFDQISKIRALQMKREAVGMDLTARTLGRRSEPLEAQCLTGDKNLVIIPAVAQYRISDAHRYLFRLSDAPALVRNAVSAALSSVISRMSVDDVLTSHRLAIQSEVMRRASAVLNERHGAGVQLMSVSLEGGTPPPEVADAFRDVARARGDAARAINQARGYANRIRPEAEGDAQRIVSEAEAEAEEMVHIATGDAERFALVAANVADQRDLA
ncbi:MAG: FtsH protease activity modulator HflK, partial [Lentisphaerae bacterium]|nr:FtsH protease activity modulator HflK [Lentisphaerota bacterium]